MEVNFAPSSPAGAAAAPPSKSIAHRYLLLSGLAKGESEVKNVALSEDIRATLGCLNALGAAWQVNGDTVFVQSGGAPLLSPTAALPCGACGSTLRFFLPVALLTGKTCRLTGTPTLMRRPLQVYEDLCRERGFDFVLEETSVTVRGRLAPDVYTLPGNVSSQFVTGLLQTLPLLSADSEIRLTGTVESRPYIDITLDALRQFGVEAGWKTERILSVPGGQAYRPSSLEVEGDWSNAAFLYALSLLHGGSVEVTGVKQTSLQGDCVCLAYFRQLQEKAFTLDLSDCPDLGPVLFAFSAAHHGARFTGTRRLRIKESDRAAAMAEELEKFGAHLRVSENEVVVPPCELHAPAQTLSGHDDHRIAMALAVLCTRTGGTLAGAQAVNKSYPSFFNDLKALKVKLDYGS